MKIINFASSQKDKNKNTVKTKAEYIYLRKSNKGKTEEKIFVSKVISTIDIPYSKYTLK